MFAITEAEFLGSVSRDDGGASALATLEALLPSFPTLLGTPNVWKTVCFLWNMPRGTPSAADWLRRLGAAWAEGISDGWHVTLSQTGKRKPGQTPMLFPHIDDEGARNRPTDRARAERNDAWRFVWHYRDLMTCLKSCLQWKAVRADYRDCSTDMARQALIVESAAAIRTGFEKWGTEAEVKVRLLPESELQKIIRGALGLPKGRDPRHKVACSLLATLPWVSVEGQPQRLTRSLVESTLESLKKRNIWVPADP
jgi:hypothetical protein